MLFKRKQNKKQTLRLNKNNKGVTLVEVIAVVAVLGVVMAAVTGFLITGAKMSANVSGTAKDSMQQQTAVEYINRWIWDADSVTVSVKADLGEETKDYYTKLILGENIEIFTATEENVVQYKIGDKEPSTLFLGEIYFECLNENTLAYHFKDGETHVVHLRKGTTITRVE